MGNEQSTQKRRPKPTNAEKNVKNGELNGHAIPTPDVTEIVASKAAAVEQKSEPPPVTITNEPKPPKKEEVDGCKLNEPAHVETTLEQKPTVAKEAESPKTVPKPSKDEGNKLFGKMFKKRSEPVKPALESNDSVDAPVDLKTDSQPTNAEKNVKNGELNGPAIPTPDVTEIVASKAAAVEQKSEPPPVTITNEPKPPKTEEVDGCKFNGPAHVETTLEQKPTVAKEAESPKTSKFFGKMFKKRSEPVKAALESKDSVDALVDLKTDSQPDKVFINSNQKEILEEVAEKLKLQLVDAIPAPPKSSSPSSLTKNISMESSSANVEEVTYLEVLSDPRTEQEPVAVAEEPLSEEPVKRKASEIHVGHLKSELPLKADAKVPEDKQPKTVDTEQALLGDKKLIQMIESIISDKREQFARENVPMCKATKHLIDEPVSKKMVKTDEESWVIIEEPGSGPSEEFQCSSTESNEVLSVKFYSKSICTKAFENSSLKPFIVDVWAKDIIHITIELCPDGSASLNKVSYGKRRSFNEKGTAWTNSPHDSVDIKTSTQPEPEPKPEGETLEPCPVEVTEENNPSEDVKEAENTVMNFFKVFVSPTKTSKDAKATPDASKEQSQKETPPAPSTNAQETPKAPPPPPPAPPKMESKAEPVVKKEETSATKAAAAAASTKAEGSAKTKSREHSFSKLFRPKPVEVEEKKPVEVQVDASKSSTLEASAKPEEPPAPKPEEKKQEKRSFGNMFKPKVLLGQVNTRIQAAASSAAASISLMSARSAPEAKKETPAPPPVAEAAPVVKAKEEPKPAVPAPQTAPDNKSIESTDNSPNMPRKMEKRNSLQLFFKNLGHKRQSDAGMQTAPATPEKSK